MFLLTRLLLIVTLCTTARIAYSFPTLYAFPEYRIYDSPEVFVNDVLPTIIGSSFPKYYLIKGADTCRFEKFDYDEWVKYHLQETVPISVLNELSYKVHLANQPYYWQQNRLQKAVCIAAYQADSLLFQWDSLRHYAAHTRKERAQHERYLRQWDQLPVQEKRIYSLSRPQFTDDGQYAVIDVNWKVDALLGGGFTFLFRRTTKGWQCIGSKLNWGVDR
jgi:hypothetical protein